MDHYGLHSLVLIYREYKFYYKNYKDSKNLCLSYGKWKFVVKKVETLIKFDDHGENLHLRLDVSLFLSPKGARRVDYQ